MASSRPGGISSSCSTAAWAVENASSTLARSSAAGVTACAVRPLRRPSRRAAAEARAPPSASRAHGRTRPSGSTRTTSVRGGRRGRRPPARRRSGTRGRTGQPPRCGTRAPTRALPPRRRSRSTASASPAPSAWWARRAASTVHRRRPLEGCERRLRATPPGDPASASPRWRAGRARAETPVRRCVA